MLLRKVVVSIILTLFVLVAGCQVDYQGASASFKYLRKGENGNNEFLSRQSGIFNSNLPMVVRK